MAFFRRESNEEKAVNELSSKKLMLITAVQKEITSIQAQINNEYQHIGSLVYNDYVEQKVGDDSSKYLNSLTKIKEFNSTILEKEHKLQEICKRYDDEIKILKESLGIREVFCPSCNKPYKVDVDFFCMYCGQKL